MSGIPTYIIDIAVTRTAKDRANRIDNIKAVVFILLVILVVGYSFYSSISNVTRPVLNAQEPLTIYLENGVTEVIVDQGKTGHYKFIGEINGKKVKFLLDTGATNVSVPTGVAKYLGMPLGEIFYTHTANGRGTSHESIVKEIKVGGITMTNLKASVSTGMRGDYILLGMTFLRDLTVVQKNGKIVLRKDG